MTDAERNRRAFDALSPARWVIVVVLGAVAIGMLLTPGQWLIEESGLSPLLGIGLVFAIETAAAIGIATTVLWGSDMDESTFGGE